MWAYILRRLLLLIPTLIGILLITFGILRFGSDPLRSSLSATGDEEGALDPKQVGQSIESGLAKARRSGRDLPAIINLRGYLNKVDIVAWLEELDRAKGGLEEADRIASEMRLWIQGRFAVEPLFQVLDDDALEHLHGPASLAFSFCAYRPLLKIDLKRLDTQAIQAITARNAELRLLRINHRNSSELGYTNDDVELAAKRSRIRTFWQDYGQDFRFGGGDRFASIVVETGFIDFFARFFTGRLESEQFQRPVFALIGERWYVSFWLQIFATCIAWGVAVPLGIRSARRDGSIEERTTTNGLFLLWSMPDFFIGSLFIFYFCTDRVGGEAWFPNRHLSSPDSMWMSTPVYVMDILWHAFLPLVCLTYGSFTVLSRYMRSQMLEQFSADYARTARAKGNDEDRVVYRHCLPNSLVTMITLGSGLLSALFGGFVIVEKIFSINGLGLLLLDAALASDAPLIMASTIISVGLLLFSILVADVLYAVVDPRIRDRYV